MAGTQVRVPVDRMALIAAIERKSNQCKKDYEKFRAEREGQVMAARDKGIAVLEGLVKLATDELAKAKKNLAEGKKMTKAQVLALADKTSVIRGDESQAEYAVRRQLPHFSTNGNHPGYDNLLRMLRMSNKKDISLTENQFREYMEGCPVAR